MTVEITLNKEHYETFCALLRHGVYVEKQKQTLQKDFAPIILICIILTGVVLTIEIAVQPSGLIRIAGVDNSISVIVPIGRTDNWNPNWIDVSGSVSHSEGGQGHRVDVFHAFPGGQG